jgi:hypothetical protein
MDIKKSKAKKDEAAFVFRKYARLGLDRTEIKPFEAYETIRGVSSSEDDAFRLLAVYDMARLLEHIDPEALGAVRAVYFFDRGKKPQRAQTSQRVLRYASDNNCDERTVYRRLKIAKELYYRLAEK